ncbi:MAG: hypothetical protein PF542_02790 [Nanoarchaeota archaeon]|nr:hypothetical protein [Nanoarchaeota archaeon]
MPDKTVTCKILLDTEEMTALQGHMKNLNIFSAKLCNKESQINTRGNNGVTKYFKIPLSIRSRKKHTGDLKYQRLDTPAKVFYIYTLQKEGEKQEKSIESPEKEDKE